MRPAQAGLTAASNSRTTLRWLTAGNFEAFLPVLVPTEWLLPARRRPVLPASTKGSAKGSVNCFGTCWGRAGAAKRLAVLRAGTNHAAMACTGASKTDSTGEGEKLTIPMINSCLREVYTGRISGWPGCQRIAHQGVGRPMTKRPPPVARPEQGATSAWCCGSNRRPSLPVRKAHPASR
jgi:hypothetical protein